METATEFNSYQMKLIKDYLDKPDTDDESFFKELGLYEVQQTE